MKSIYLTLFGGEKPFDPNNKEQKVISLFIEDIKKITPELLVKEMIEKIIKNEQTTKN